LSRFYFLKTFLLLFERFHLNGF